MVRAADDPPDAVRYGRMVTLLMPLLLLTGAAWILYRPGGGWLSLAGLLAACTPMALFLAASLSPSGLSASAGIALTASLIGLTRPGGSGRAWMLLGVSSAMLALSHPTGLGWTVALLAGFVVVYGLRRSWRLVRNQLGVAWPGLSLVAISLVAALVWTLNYGTAAVELRGLHSALGQVPGNYWDFTRQLVGVFGYLEFRLPRPVYLMWLCSVGALVLAGISAGSPRERKVIALTAALAVAAPVALWAVFGRAVGNGLTGRIFLPVMVALPMLCGEIVYRHRSELHRRTVAALTPFLLLPGLVHFVAWYINGRRSAVGVGGPLLFPLDAQWAPPLGWLPWLIVALLGGLLLASVPLARVPVAHGPGMRPRQA